MLKPIDLLIGLKIACSNLNLTQIELANKLCLSSSQINSAIKILITANLFTLKNDKPYPIIFAIEEFVLSGVKYCFPAETGELTIGMPTAYGADPLRAELMPNRDPIPVWPYVAGKNRGIAMQPLHKNIPLALTQYPDPELLLILVLIDALRIGRARDKAIAEKHLHQQFNKIATRLKRYPLE